MWCSLVMKRGGEGTQPAVAVSSSFQIPHAREVHPLAEPSRSPAKRMGLFWTSAARPPVMTYGARITSSQVTKLT